MARPRFKMTEEKRKTVLALAGYGLKHEQIAHLIGIRSAKTLRKYCRSELTGGDGGSQCPGSPDTVQNGHFRSASGVDHVLAQDPGPVARKCCRGAGFAARSHPDHFAGGR